MARIQNQLPKNVLNKLKEHAVKLIILFPQLS